MDENVVITYYSSSEKETKDRPISNIKVKASGGKFYVQAFCGLANAVRTFSFENILSMTVDNNPMDKYIFFKDYFNMNKNEMLKSLENELKKAKEEMDKKIAICKQNIEYLNNIE